MPFGPLRLQYRCFAAIVLTDAQNSVWFSPFLGGTTRRVARATSCEDSELCFVERYDWPGAMIGASHLFTVPVDRGDHLCPPPTSAWTADFSVYI